MALRLVVDGRTSARAPRPGQAGGEVRWDMGGVRRVAGEDEQVVALRVAQPQRSCERTEQRRGRVLRAALLEAREVLDRDARERRDLLAAQARRAAPARPRRT